MQAVVFLECVRCHRRVFAVTKAGVEDSFSASPVGTNDISGAPWVATEEHWRRVATRHGVGEVCPSCSILEEGR